MGQDPAIADKANQVQGIRPQENPKSSMHGEKFGRSGRIAIQEVLEEVGKSMEFSGLMKRYLKDPEKGLSKEDKEKLIKLIGYFAEKNEDSSPEKAALAREVLSHLTKGDKVEKPVGVPDRPEEKAIKY